MWRHTNLILLPYSFSSSASVGSTRLQKGHWKSEKIWIVTFALAGPLTGLCASGAGISFFSGGGGPFASFISSSYTLALGTPLATKALALASCSSIAFL